MKKMLFFGAIFLLVAFISQNVYAQNISEKSSLIFVFNSKEDFTNNFKNKNNSKMYEFVIEGIMSPEHKQQIINQFKAYRGVEDFQITNKLDEGKYAAKIILYEYADHWMYYKFLFIKNGIDEIKIAKELIESEKLSEF